MSSNPTADHLGVTLYRAAVILLLMVSITLQARSVSGTIPDMDGQAIFIATFIAVSLAMISLILRPGADLYGEIKASQ